MSFAPQIHLPHPFPVFCFQYLELRKRESFCIPSPILSSSISFPLFISLFYPCPYLSPSPFTASPFPVSVFPPYSYINLSLHHSVISSVPSFPSLWSPYIFLLFLPLFLSFLSHLFSTFSLNISLFLQVAT